MLLLQQTKIFRRLGVSGKSDVEFYERSLEVGFQDVVNHVSRKNHLSPLAIVCVDPHLQNLPLLFNVSHCCSTETLAPQEDWRNFFSSLARQAVRALFFSSACFRSFSMRKPSRFQSASMVEYRTKTLRSSSAVKTCVKNVNLADTSMMWRFRCTFLCLNLSSFL